MIATITRHDYFRPDGTEHKVVPVCDEHPTDEKGEFIDEVWEKDREYWYCELCDQEARRESYREEQP